MTRAGGSCATRVAATTNTPCVKLIRVPRHPRLRLLSRVCWPESLPAKPVLQFVYETFLHCRGGFKHGDIVRSQGGNGALELDTQLPNLRDTCGRVEFVFLRCFFDGQNNSPYYWVPNYSARLFCCRIARADLVGFQLVLAVLHLLPQGFDSVLPDTRRFHGLGR